MIIIFFTPYKIFEEKKTVTEADRIRQKSVVFADIVFIFINTGQRILNLLLVDLIQYLALSVNNDKLLRAEVGKDKIFFIRRVLCGFIIISGHVPIIVVIIFFDDNFIIIGGFFGNRAASGNHKTA